MPYPANSQLEVGVHPLPVTSFPSHHCFQPIKPFTADQLALSTAAASAHHVVWHLRKCTWLHKMHILQSGYKGTGPPWPNSTATPPGGALHSAKCISSAVLHVQHSTTAWRILQSPLSQPHQSMDRHAALRMLQPILYRSTGNPRHKPTEENMQKHAPRPRRSCLIAIAHSAGHRKRCSYPHAAWVGLGVTLTSSTALGIILKQTRTPQLGQLLAGYLECAAAPSFPPCRPDNTRRTPCTATAAA